MSNWWRGFRASVERHGKHRPQASTARKTSMLVFRL
jgi:hypothetical protein